MNLFISTPTLKHFQEKLFTKRVTFLPKYLNFNSLTFKHEIKKLKKLTVLRSLQENLCCHPKMILPLFRSFYFHQNSSFVTTLLSSSLSLVPFSSFRRFVVVDLSSIESSSLQWKEAEADELRISWRQLTS
jgi:hypothetical protein